MAGGPWTGLLAGVLTLPLRTTGWLWTRPEAHADAGEPHGDVAARRAMQARSRRQVSGARRSSLRQLAATRA